MDSQPCRCSAEEVQALLCEYLDSGTSEARSREIREQIAACPECLQRLRNEREVRTIIQTCCQTESAPGYLRERITTQIRISRRG
ncbi:zf-HC2 domain-containing protein [Corynebacterium doosanense]|uniref:Antirepressor n=1 Tax=Corynebacterium doosanense CAU 212 = DSM 45436 TaxID=558173 RepID=A0A097IEC3_9CORY|nr:zf-HC2 domain-containing protein [Corynebacterium doosanense]AIT60460.1 antirepressor [Corynebacterium doosanense CAU 212 = DSM 45436]